MPKAVIKFREDEGLSSYLVLDQVVRFSLSEDGGLCYSTVHGPFVTYTACDPEFVAEFLEYFGLSSE